MHASEEAERALQAARVDIMCCVGTVHSASTQHSSAPRGLLNKSMVAAREHGGGSQCPARITPVSSW